MCQVTSLKVCTLLVTLMSLISLNYCQLPRVNVTRIAEMNRIPWRPIKNPLNRIGYIHSSASEVRSFTSSEETGMSNGPDDQMNHRHHNHNHMGPVSSGSDASNQQQSRGSTVGLDIPDSNIRLLLDIDELAAKSQSESVKFKVHNSEGSIINTGPPYSAPLSVEGSNNNYMNIRGNPSVSSSPVHAHHQHHQHHRTASYPLPSPSLPSNSLNNKKYQIGYVRAQDLQAALNTGVIPPGAKAYPVPPTSTMPLPSLMSSSSSSSSSSNNNNNQYSPSSSSSSPSANGQGNFQASAQYMVKYSQPLPGDGSFTSSNSPVLPAVSSVSSSSSSSSSPLAPSTSTSSSSSIDTSASGTLSVAAASNSKTNARPNSASALNAPVKNARKKQQQQQQQQQQQSGKQVRKSNKKKSSRSRAKQLDSSATTTVATTTTVESTTATSTLEPVFFREETTEAAAARLQAGKVNQKQLQQQRQSDDFNDDVQIQQQYQDAEEFDDEMQAKLIDSSSTSAPTTTTSTTTTSTTTTAAPTTTAPTTTTSTTARTTTTESGPSAALLEQQEDQVEADDEIERQPERPTERLQVKGQQREPAQQQVKSSESNRKKPPAPQVSERLRLTNNLRDMLTDEEESNGNSEEETDDLEDGFELLRTPAFMSNLANGVSASSGSSSSSSSSSGTCSPKSSLLVSSATAETLTIKEFAAKIGADALFNKLPGVEEQLQSMADFANSGYTLFLPSNDAISRLPKSLFNKLKSNPEEIKKLLDNHVSDSKRDMNDMARNNSFMSPRAASAKLKLAKGIDGSIVVNGQRIVRMNQRGPMGGSIHVIDGLLYPIADKNVMETLKSCNRFDGFVTLAEGTGLGDTLSTGGPYTVFVPSNEALQKIPDSDLEKIRNNMTALKEFLMYHVAEGAFYSADLKDGQFIPSLIPDQDIQVGVRVDGCSRRLVEANVSPLYRADIPASNGVIHVIDWILKPNDRDWCESVVLPRRR